MQTLIPRTVAAALALLAFLATAGVSTAGLSSTVTYPADGETVSGATLTISGTVTADEGIQVCSVEISTDGGSTWAPVVGTTSWSYIWAVPADGLYHIHSRVRDANGYIETSATGVTVRVQNADQTIH